MESVHADDDDDAVEKAAERRKSRLNTAVALTVALLATFMGICKVKDDNIVQGMQQAQAQEVDNWNYYQARNIRLAIAQSTADKLILDMQSASPATKSKYQEMAAKYQQIADEQEKDKKKTKSDAEGNHKDYDRLNYRDDQFDMSDALISIAISLLAVTSLTQKRWLFGLAMIPTLFGVLMGMAGLCGWHIHPGWLTKLLS